MIISTFGEQMHPTAGKFKPAPALAGAAPVI